MDMQKIIMETARRLIKEGYTSADIEEIKEDNFLTDEDAEQLFDAMQEIENE